MCVIIPSVRLTNCCECTSSQYWKKNPPSSLCVRLSVCVCVKKVSRCYFQLAPCSPQWKNLFVSTRLKNRAVVTLLFSAPHVIQGNISPLLLIDFLEEEGQGKGGGDIETPAYSISHRDVFFIFFQYVEKRETANISEAAPLLCDSISPAEICLSAAALLLALMSFFLRVCVSVCMCEREKIYSTETVYVWISE